MESLVIAMDYFTTIVTVVIGFVLCFWGYKTFKSAITLSGLILGYQIAGYIKTIILNYTGKPLEEPIPITITALFSIVCAVLAYSYYKKAVIFTVAYFVTKYLYLAVADNASGTMSVNKNKLIMLAICLVIGFAAGFLCFYAQKWAIIVLTSWGGGMLLSSIVLTYIGGYEIIRQTAKFIAVTLFQSNISKSFALSGMMVLVFCILGMTVQVTTSKK